MTQEKFEIQFNKELDVLKELVIIKGKEYVRNNNPFHNFDQGALFTDQTRESVLYGFLLKHLISLNDIITDYEKFALPIDKDQLNEKIRDINVYLLILKIMVNE